MLWVPQTEGTPNTHANRARAYWPGPKYVDWVGTDFYSRFPNFTDLKTFYDDFPKKPFVFGEWALWGGDDDAFVRRFFSFVNTHKRVRMLLYNQGNLTGGPFRLTRYPDSTAAIKRALTKQRFLGMP
jgi:beta-mannanase